jgi:Na+-driven multidrug efflux pump
LSSIQSLVWPDLVGFERRVLTKSPYPTVILSYILQNSIQTVSIMITGRLGAEELSAAAFSMMLAYVTGE